MKIGYKTRLTGPDGTIWCEASPTLSEDRQASYNHYDIVHLPAEILSYKNTGSRTFQLHIKMFSRNFKEAFTNSRNLDLARSWLLPRFGGISNGVGATPPILYLTAYKNRNLTNVPVVLKSYSFNFPDDVDYISYADETTDRDTGQTYTEAFGVRDFEPFPTISSLVLTLQEAWSAEQIRNGAWRIKKAYMPQREDIDGDSEGAHDSYDKKLVSNSTPEVFQSTSSLEVNKNPDNKQQSVATEQTKQLEKLQYNPFVSNSNVKPSNVYNFLAKNGYTDSVDRLTSQAYSLDGKPILLKTTTDPFGKNPQTFDSIDWKDTYKGSESSYSNLIP